jgi:hypothetical protein
LIVSCVSRADDTCDEQTLYLTRAATKVESECKEFDKTFAVGPCKSDGRVGTCSHTARKSHYYAPRYSAASAKPECEQHRGRFVAP